ncbi:MAG: hypothetical protein IMZ71_00735 [Chloroflexi bacterium]|nr:hypothetical protein [Chloroflexota bacterium]
MDLASFGKLAMPVQSIEEWRLTLEFLEGYFRNRGVEFPSIVEVGIQSNLQKAFYERFLGARHIGVDCSDKYSKPDVMGDALSERTLDRAIDMADGDFDMVFLDAGQHYPEVKGYFDLWGPHAKHVIALHPIFTTEAHPDGSRRLWRELNEENHGSEYRFVSFRHVVGSNDPCFRYQYGLGLLLKG